MDSLRVIRARVEEVQNSSRGWIKGEKRYYSKEAAELIDKDIPDLLDLVEGARIVVLQFLGEIEADPMAAQFFDLRIIEQAKAFLATIKGD